MEARKQPSYCIGVAGSGAPRDGAFVEQVGDYNPMTDPPTIVVDEEKALKWLRLGAQPSDAVVRVLRNLGTLDKIKNP